MRVDSVTDDLATLSFDGLAGAQATESQSKQVPWGTFKGLVRPRDRASYSLSTIDRA